MAKSDNRTPPLPFIPALDPAEFEKAWSDAPRLLSALNGARLGAWYWDIETGRVNWSRGAQALFGLDPKRPLRTQVNYIDLIPEEDRGEVIELFKRVLDGNPSTSAFRHRIRWPDGSLHWLEISGSLQLDADGKQRIMGVIRDISSQQAREQALRQSEQRFSTLFHMSPESVVLVRLADSVITEANQHFATTFGWPIHEAIGHSTLDLNIWVDPKQREVLRQTLDDNGEYCIQEVQLRTRDGRLLDGVISSQHIELDGDSYILASFRDITEHNRADAALRSSEAKFAQAFRHTPDAVVITEKDSGRFIEVNPSFERQFGWRAADAVGRTSLELGIWATPDDRQRMLDGLSTGSLDALEVRLISRSGEISDNLLFGGEIEHDGHTCLVLTVRDITAQRAQERALQDSQERLELALESADLGTWDWHIPSTILFASPRAALLHGMPRKPFSDDFREFFRHVPREDRRNMRRIYNEMVEGARDHFQVTYRVQYADQQVHFLESTAKLYRDSDGEPLRMAGTLIDISERVVRERRLKASEEKFSTLFQASPDPVCVSRIRDGVFIEINDSFSQVFGWKPEELVGRSGPEPISGPNPRNACACTTSSPRNRA